MMLRVFFADISGFLPKEGDIELSGYRREKLQSITNPKRRQECLAAEALLNMAVRECDPGTPLPLDITVGESGKPKMNNGSFFFNISHSGSYVVCALSDREVGVDVQRLSPCNMSVVRRFFSPEEAEYISRADDQGAAFTEVWSLKESCIKALGETLGDGIGHCRVKPECLPGLSVWHTVLDDCHLSVCLRGEMPNQITLERIELL